MAWNEPGGSKDNDPWGKPNKDQGPPDLDEVVRKLQDKLGGLFGGRKGGAGGGGPLRAGALGIGIILGVIALVWIASGLYIIAPAERGVVLRFGDYQETTTPGLHWHIPFPIEGVEKVNVDEIRTAEIGYRTGGRGQRGGATSIASESLMLTRDENIVDIKFAVQYKVKSASDFLFNVLDPTVTLNQAIESAVREVVGKSDMDFVLTEGRSDIANRVAELGQGILDLYGTGLQVISVNMQDAQPPEEVQAAFDDAVKAREDEQRLINEAEAYSNDILPKARGLAARQIEEANAYKEQVIAQSEGEASRFSQILAEYQKAPEVTRQRLYLETMEKVLGNTDKVMVDVTGGNNMMFLPLDQLRRPREGSSSQRFVDSISGSAMGTPDSGAGEQLDRVSTQREPLRSRERR